MLLYTYIDAYFSLSSGVTEGAMLDKALSMSACVILIFSLNTGFYNNNKKHFHLPQLAESSNKSLSKFQVSGNKAGSRLQALRGKFSSALTISSTKTNKFLTKKN
jgi:hypothetical protein